MYILAKKALKVIMASLLIIVMITGIVACNPDTAADTTDENTSAGSNNDSSNSTTGGSNNSSSNTQDNSNTESRSAAPESQAPAANTSPITVVWYPNESSNTHTEIRAEVNRLIEQATGRPAVERLTTDYTIAIEAIASGAADIAMAMGAVGYIEARNRNPAVDVIFVNSDADAPFNQYAGKQFTVIASVPVFNGPNVVNRQTLTEEEIEAITALFTSEEVASNPLLFFDPNIEGATGLYRKTSSYGYVRTTDSWYDPYR